MSWSSAATFYDQLRALVAAGMPLPRALELAGDAAGGTHRAWAKQWATGCSGGLALAPQLTAAGEAPLATALVAAGEASGRLGELCGEVAGFFRHLVTTRNLIIARLIYPVCLAHVALTAMAIPAVVAGHSPWLLLAGPAALWAVGGGLALAARLASRDLLARLALQPGAAGLTWPLVATNTCTVLHAAVAAGMLHHAALELAAPACGNRVIAARLRTAASGLVTGSVPTMAAALGGAGYSATVVQLVANGGQAGGGPAPGGGRQPRIVPSAQRMDGAHRLRGVLRPDHARRRLHRHCAVERLPGHDQRSRERHRQMTPWRRPCATPARAAIPALFLAIAGS